ncbi:saccharopine dehydrogenase-like oxidoreductase [Eurosta solidaginis]|uniref:saccharopine dehydrogenase-like oxidoreductase n=1 Tax=Eurosta solidaginis TaxID=178769 RepID=UPI0035307ED7
MSEKLDVIIFGASGFTGKYTVFEAVNVLQNYRWGIAGRSQTKLENVLKDMGAKAQKNLMSTPVIIADIENEGSLIAMASKCRVLVNCCGPYRFFGEQVVRACLEAGTHHVDVSGEPQYMETMQLKYNKLAQERKVYIISACGFDSIPVDLGIIFIDKNFDGVVNSVESYLQTYTKGESQGGAGIHYGTWESAVYGLAHSNELREIRRKLYSEKLPKFQPILKPRPLFFRSDIGNGICLPFPGSDRSVVMRSQRFLYEQEHKRPVQMHAYIVFKTWIAAILVALFGVTFGILTKFSFGRQLLVKYPKVFSLGFFSHEGPSEAQMESVQFSFIMRANGWPKSEKLLEASDQYADLPSKTLTVKVSGSNPGYGATCVAVLSTAVTILKENDKMPGSGGVLAPGAAFAKTSLISELEKYDRGIKFEILANK